MVIKLKHDDLIIKKEKVADLCFEVDIKDIRNKVLDLVHSNNCQWRILRNELDGHSLFVYDTNESIFLHSHSNKKNKEEMMQELIEKVQKDKIGLGGDLSVNAEDVALKWNKDNKLFAISIDLNSKLSKEYTIQINDTTMINLCDMVKNIRALSLEDESIDLGEIDPNLKGVYTSICKDKSKLNVVLTTYEPFVTNLRTKTGSWVI